MNTVTEGIALSTLLRWILHENFCGLKAPTSEQAMNAASVLAGNALRTGTCHYSPDSVYRKWQEKNPRVVVSVDQGAKRMELTQGHYELAAVAYNAYRKQTGGKSAITGETLPSFDGLAPVVKDAWAAAAIAVSLDADMAERRLQRYLAMNLWFLLRWIFQEGLGEFAIPSSERAMNAAAALAEKVSKFGPAHFTADSVIRKWKEKNPRVVISVDQGAN